jgi:hypothetical protein
MAGLLKPASQKSKIRRLGNQPTDNPGRNPSTRPSQITSQSTKEMSREDKFFSTPPDKMADPTAGKRY